MIATTFSVQPTDKCSFNDWIHQSQIFDRCVFFLSSSSSVPCLTSDDTKKPVYDYRRNQSTFFIPVTRRHSGRCKPSEIVIFHRNPWPRAFVCRIISFYHSFFLEGVILREIRLGSIYWHQKKTKPRRERNQIKAPHCGINLHWFAFDGAKKANKKK